MRLLRRRRPVRPPSMWPLVIRLLEADQCKREARRERERERLRNYRRGYL